MHSMKKLQKAVHGKQQNVSTEKAEFEEARKDLEARLKEIKREIDQLINPNAPQFNLGSGNISEGGNNAVTS